MPFQREWNSSPQEVLQIHRWISGPPLSECIYNRHEVASQSGPSGIYSLLPCLVSFSMVALYV